MPSMNCVIAMFNEQSLTTHRQSINCIVFIYKLAIFCQEVSLMWIVTKRLFACGHRRVERETTAFPSRSSLGLEIE
jgi:hypothetical protein